MRARHKFCQRRFEGNPQEPTSSNIAIACSWRAHFARCSTTGATQCASISILPVSPFFYSGWTLAASNTGQRRSRRRARRALRPTRRGSRVADRTKQQQPAATTAAAGISHRSNTPNGQLAATQNFGQTRGRERTFPLESRSPNPPSHRSKHPPPEIHSRLHPRRLSLSDCRASCSITPSPPLGSRLSQSRRGGPHSE